MGLTSHKERHIIKCLGLAQREEKCGMSPADREEDLMLFIREHLPETAFSLFALDTAPLPLESAHRRADSGGKGTLPPYPPPPPPLCSRPPSVSPRTRAWVYRAPHPPPSVPALCSAPYSIFLPQRCFVALKAPLSPVLHGVNEFSSTPSSFQSGPRMPSVSGLLRRQDAYKERPSQQVLLGGFPPNS